MRNSRTGALLASALLLLGPGFLAGQEADAEGTWTARLTDDEPPRLQLRISRWGDDDRWESGLGLEGAELRVVTRQLTGGDGDVTFAVTREAGTVTFEGTMRGSRGQGDFRFVEDPAFRSTMRELGYGRLDDDEVFAAALLDVGPAQARRMADLGFDLDLDELFSSAIFDVDRDFVEDMDRAGYSDLPFDDLVSLRVHDITPETIADAQSLGFGQLDLDDVMAMEIHGVTPEYVESIEAAGVPLRDFDDAVAFRIHDITPETFADARDLGFGPLDADDVMTMKIHGVTAEYIATMEEAGVSFSDFDDTVAFRIHGIDADFIRELESYGLEGLDNDDLLRIKIHGFDEILKKQRRVRRN
jgi:hypothetical protein